MTLPPDVVLVETYTQVRLTADQIAVESESRRAFMERLPIEYSDADPEITTKRLLNLRRRGKLPTLRHTNS